MLTRFKIVFGALPMPRYSYKGHQRVSDSYLSAVHYKGAADEVHALQWVPFSFCMGA